MHWHPSTMHALAKLRADQFVREAEEWRAALSAAQSQPDSGGRLAGAVAWWRSRLPRRRAETAPLAEPERP